MDITDENNEERRTSFKKITQEEDNKKESLYWGWQGKTGGVPGGATAAVSNQPQTYKRSEPVSTRDHLFAE